MKKFKIFMLCALMLLIAGVSVSYAAQSEKSESATSVTVPSSLQQKVISLAIENHCISEADAKVLQETNGIQQCVNVFVNSGYNPAAVVDKLAELSVKAGHYNDVSSAKKGMKAEAEKLRKDESNWAKLYSILGL